MSTVRVYQHPRWPGEDFFLHALDGGWTLGPFPSDGWGQSPDGAVFWSDGYTKPVVLRVTGQDGDVLHANDGHEPMDYRVVPVSQAPPEWLGT